MKKINLLATTLLAAALVLPASAEDIVKTGFNFGVLPAVSYSSDQGFQYGAIVNLFHYGDGSRYPAYDHSLYLEASKYTKGTSVLRFYYDSDRLIDGINTFVDLGYIGNSMQDFYGFNGYRSYYNSDIAKNAESALYNRGFYKMQQNKLYFQADLRGSLGLDNLYWVAGLGYYHYTVGDLNFDKLNKGKSDDKKLPENVPSLYDLYCANGLISADEADGGNLGLVKAGITYDSRNAKSNPSKGIYTEAMLEYAVPGVSESSYLAYSLTHRQYFGLLPDRLNLAYRVDVQGTIGSNKMPFYRLPQLMGNFTRRSMTTGLGGAYTLRGALLNRVVGDGFALANLELRWKVVKFTVGKQNIYVGLNPFVDAGYVFDPIDLELNELQKQSCMLTGEKDGIHTTAGCGLKLAMNENFVVSCDVGKALNEQDNDGLGVYIALNYLF